MSDSSSYGRHWSSRGVVLVAVIALPQSLRTRCSHGLCEALGGANTLNARGNTSPHSSVLAHSTPLLVARSVEDLRFKTALAAQNAKTNTMGVVVVETPTNYTISRVTDPKTAAKRREGRVIFRVALERRKPFSSHVKSSISLYIS